MFKHSLRWRTIMMYVLIFTLVLPNVLLPKAHASTNGNVNILSAVNNNVDRNLVNVVYANGKYTAVGEKGRIVQSTDGLNWAVVNTGVSNEKTSWRSLVYANHVYVAVGVESTPNKARLIVSSDGETWVDKSSGINGDILQKVVYTNGNFYAVGGKWHASDRAQDVGIIYSSSDGVTWTLSSTVPKIWPSNGTSSSPFHLTDMAYISGRYVVGGNVFSGYAYSSNGSSWTNVFLNGTSSLERFSIYNGKLYLIKNSTIGYSSSDGITFAPDASYNNAMSTVKAGSTLYRFGQAGKLDSSTDNGVNWTSEPTVTNMTIQSAASNGTGMVLVTSAPNSLVVTADKSEWKKTAANLQGIAYNGSTWVVVGDSLYGSDTTDSLILNSNSDWEHLSTNSQLLPKEAFSKVAYGHNTFVAMGKKIGVSSDGEHWTLSNLPAGVTGRVVALTYGASGGFVAVTGTGDTLNSVDGLSWTKGTNILIPNRDIFNVKYVNGAYIATGYGVIWKSDANGMNWTQIIDPNDEIHENYYSLNDIIYVDGKYVIAGSDESSFPILLETTGVLNTSSTWTRHNIDTINYTGLKSITYGDGIYVAVGTLYEYDIYGRMIEHYMMYSSSDLVNWTTYDETTLGIVGKGLNTVYYHDGKFYIAGNDNARIVLGSATMGSNNAGLTTVLGQTDSAPGGGDGTTSGTAVNWAVNVPNTTSTLGLANLVLADNQAKMELFSNSDYSTGAVTGNSTIPLTAGGAITAYIKVTAADNTTVQYYAVTVNRTATLETTPAAVISYVDEKLTGLVPNAAYSINGANAVADGLGHITIDNSWIGTTLSIVKKGNGTSTTDSSAQTLVIPSRPATPTGISKTDETSNGAHDGTITNVTDQMEYKQDINGSWTAIDDTSVTGLAPSTYYIRTKATSSTFASTETPVTLGSTSVTPEATPAAVINYVDEQLTGLVPNAAYSINGANVVTDGSGYITIDNSWIGTTLSIVRTGNGITTTDSSAQTLIIPSRPTTPFGIGKTDETFDGANDGTITNVTDQMEYKQDVNGSWTAIDNTTITALTPDRYYVRIKATFSAFASAEAPVTIGSASATPETTPEAVISYADEQLTGLVPNAPYSINGASAVTDGSGQITIDNSWIGTTLSIVKPGNGTTTTDSSVQTLVIPSRPATPTEVGKTNVTSNGAHDGTLTNVTDQMEYKKDINGAWTTIYDTTVTGLEPSTYYVRTKATSSTFASSETPVTVGSSASVPAAPNVTADDQNNTIIGLDTTMEYQIDNGAFVHFNGSNTPDLSGEHTVKVRVAASGSVPAGTEKTLHFTANLATDLIVVAVDPSGSTNDGKTLITVTPAIQAIGHRFVYKNFGTGNINVPAIGDVATDYENWTNNGLINAANGDKIAVAEVDAEGKIVKFGWTSSVVTNEPAPGTNNPDVPVVSPPSGGNNTTNPTTNNGNNSNTNASDEDVIIIVNGKTENAGKMKTTEANGVKTTVLIVDPVKLQAKLDAEGPRAIVTIPVKSSSNVIVGELNGQSVKNMERLSATLVLQTDQASYTLPASEINIDAFAESLGNGLKLEDIVVRITIAKSSDTMNQVAVNAAAQGDFTLVASPVDFTVTGQYNGQTTEITKFNAYVERRIALSPEIDPNKITTGIVVEPDGTVRHVPTKVVVDQGTFYAEINSLTNSTYGIIWNPLTFADVEKHWAKDAVNEMGSRMVIQGVNDTTFNPNKAITRAEFAAIIVRGLGLKLGEGTQPFRDVTTNDWYSSAVQTAASYELINGFEDGTFRPNDTITREQAMTLIARAMKLTGLADQYATLDANEILSTFKDSANAGNWAKDNIALTAKAGLISGRSDGNLAAKANVTRAEVATLIHRLLSKSDLI
ncbi:S-layer homology domain-containing protein [Paenibacillus sp. FSL H8-0079]|uniref:S-layer homology domain-containing protein n=1 Tax=Paenibacillus sp. FSL H8-0079 TaxID=2921375 RepID=UPI0030EF5573